MMITISKALVGTIAAGAMAVGMASPAQAQSRDRDRGISTGEVIAGALIIGGIAAVAASAGNNRGYDARYDDRRYDNRRYDDRRYDDRRYDNRRYDDRRYDNRNYRRTGERAAVQQCVRAAEQTANRQSYGGRSQVTDIRSVNSKRYGWEIKGRIAVPADTRGYSRNQRFQEGRFTCEVRGGRISDLKFNGIRGLR